MQLRTGAGLQAHAVGLVVTHVGVLLHLGFVFLVVGEGVDQELVIELSLVPDRKFDLLALPDLDPIGRIGHGAVPFSHDDLDGAEGLGGIARLSCLEAVRRVTARVSPVGLAMRGGPWHRLGPYAAAARASSTAPDSPITRLMDDPLLRSTKRLLELGLHGATRRQHDLHCALKVSREWNA